MLIQVGQLSVPDLLRKLFQKQFDVLMTVMAEVVGLDVIATSSEFRKCTRQPEFPWKLVM